MTYHFAETSKLQGFFVKSILALTGFFMIIVLWRKVENRAMTLLLDVLIVLLTYGT